jgi:hypothetical protein
VGILAGYFRSLDRNAGFSPKGSMSALAMMRLFRKKNGLWREASELRD